MVDRYDVVVVGARCAGSPLATLLARAGLTVAVVDRATFPSDTPSTHFFQTEGLNSLERLGVVGQLVATGAPFIDRVHFRVEDISYQGPWPTRPGDAGTTMSVRRPVLDTILVEAAADAGAEIHTGTKVTGLLEEDGRVAGVTVRADRRHMDLHASLVIGADGTGSTVGGLVNARMYNVSRGERFFCWAYYEGVDGGPAVGRFQRWDEELMIGFPCDSGLFLVGVGPPLTRLAEFGADGERSFDTHVARSEALASLVHAPGVRRVGRLHRMTNLDGYFRESAGPGWALVGDAGHFKDPTPAQGISDALRQVDRLAPCIVSGLDGTRPLDDALTEWWRWRDADAAEHYWFATDMGRAGRMPYAFVEGMRMLLDRPNRSQGFLDLLNHRATPTELLTPALIGRASWRLLTGRGRPRRDVLAQMWGLAGNELRRRKMNKSPVYAEP